MPDRAVVAVSSDRQWLVVLQPTGVWRVMQWDGVVNNTYESPALLTDTGQSAEDVLREFLEGKDA